MASASPMSPAGTPVAFALSRQQAERVTGGRWIGTVSDVRLRGAASDSRQVRKGCLFACLPGARVDGHDFAAGAVAQGAALILAAKALPGIAPQAAPVLIVADVALALAALAAELRRGLDAMAWIGVTGSNGKTTVKELIAAACSAVGSVHATLGNLNNHLGVPLTVLNTAVDAKFAVVEMGANHAGEIAQLAAIASPSIGVISSLGPAHLEGFGSLEGVARAKSELFAALPPGATAILGVAGLDMVAARHGTSMAKLLAPVRDAAAGRRLVLVGGNECPVDGAVEDDAIVLRTPEGEARLPLLGAHNLANAAVAYQAALAAGVPGARALAGMARVLPVGGRLAARRAGAHVILDDTYNANPGSMMAGLQVLASRPGLRLAVLGGMGELGPDAAHGHRLVGTEAARLGLPLIAVGARGGEILDGYRSAGGADGVLVATREDAVAAAMAKLAAGPTTVLVKASRSSGLEAVVEGLIASITGGSRGGAC